MKTIYVTIGFVLLFGTIRSGKAQSPEVLINSVVQEAYIPWDLAWWGEDTLLFSQRNGLIQRSALQTNTTKTLYTVPDVAELQHAGLMGMVLHPQWPDSSAIFITYTYYTPQFDVLLRVERLKYDAIQDSLIPAGSLVEGIPGASTTTGARLLATDDGYLFLSVGDINLGSVSQDLQSPNGKIHRFHLDGSIPLDNPFPNNSVYSLGHRNVQGLAISPMGQLYASEHGNFSNDEVNLIVAGGNYGWPEVSGPCNGQPICQNSSIKNPLYTWSSPIAPCGLAYKSRTEGGVMFMTGLAGKSLYQLTLNPTGTEIISVDTLLTDQMGRIRDVLVSPNGRVFVSTSNRDGLQAPQPLDDQIFEVFVIPVGLEPVLSPQQRVLVHLHQRQLTLQVPKGIGAQFHAQLINQHGKIVWQAELPSGDPTVQYPLSTLVSGVYYLSIYSQNHLYQTEPLILH